MISALYFRGSGDWGPNVPYLPRQCLYRDGCKVAERVGNQIAGAISNAQLYIERKRAEEAAARLAQENAVMAEIGRIISSTLNIDEVYERFAEEVRKLIPFDRIAVTSALILRTAPARSLMLGSRSSASATG